MADPTVISNLTKQLLASSDPTKWTGAGFGSAENNAADMAKILSGIGITDVKQFGEIPLYQNLETEYQYNGKPATKNADGTFTVQDVVGSNYDGDPVYQSRVVPASDVKTVYGNPETTYYGEGDARTSFVPVDSSKVIIKDGKPVIQTGTTYGNKETGQTVGNTYGERQIGNAWGGTYAGSGNTGYRVQFDAQGNPHFYTTGASSSNAADYAPLLGIASLALGLPGVFGGALNSGIGLGLGAAGEAALGGAIAGGGIAGLTGQDVLKGAVLGGLGGYAQGSGMFSGTDPNMTFNAGAENVFDPNAAGMPLDIGAGGGNPYAGTPTISDAEAGFENFTKPQDLMTQQDWADLYAQPTTNPVTGATRTGLNVADYNVQNLDISPKNLASYNTAMQDLADNGGFTSQWQTVGSDRIMLNDDGTGIGINTETGATYALDPKQVTTMTKQGLLNSGTSGYVAATGGTGNTPGGTPTTTNTSISSLLGKAAVGALLGGGAKAVIDAANKTTTGAGGGGGDGFNPVGGYTFNPSMFQASVPNPNYFRPGSEVVTVADAVRRAQAAQQQQPVAMAEGGQASSKPKYTAKAQLAAMSPWERAAAQFNNAAYAARMPVGAQMPQGNIQQLGSFARGGGISDLGAYSDGGRMLKGPGDGMSDSIPARIGAHREARLADGEFVIPADVVSGLGNGSTDAGAKQLYKMMDRVRMARTGSKKQGREINADKQLPV